MPCAFEEKTESPLIIIMALFYPSLSQRLALVDAPGKINGQINLEPAPQSASWRFTTNVC